MAEPVKIRPGTIYFFLWILMKIESIFSGAGRRRLSSTLWPELQDFVQKLWSIFPFWMSKHLIHINKTFKQINTSFYNFQQKIDFAWCIEQVYFTFLESDLIRKKGPQIFWTIIFGFRSQWVWLFARACLTQCIIKICLISIFWPPCLIWHIHHCKTRTYG